jgi:hypothetical protein
MTTVSSALAQRDIARADDAILRYRAIPGADPELAAGWTRRLWTIVDRESSPGMAALAPTIAQLSRQFRHQQNMSDRQFRRWIEQNMTVDSNLIVSNVEIGKRTSGTCPKSKAQAPIRASRQMAYNHCLLWD